MSVIIDLKVTNSVSILGTNAPVFSAAFDSIVSGRCCILVIGEKTLNQAIYEGG